MDKYNITGLVNGNGLLGMADAVNTASSNILGLSILLLILTYSTYIIQRKTNDLAKGFIQGLFITNIVGVLMYYAGQSFGTTLINPLILLAGLTMDAIGIGWLAFSRQTRRENR